MSTRVGHGRLLRKGDIDLRIQKQTGRQGRKKGQYVQRHLQSTWYFPGSELLRVIEKLVQDQQELKLERQGEAKCRQPNHHTNGFIVLT